MVKDTVAGKSGSLHASKKLVFFIAQYPNVLVCVG